METSIAPAAVSIAPNRWAICVARRPPRSMPVGLADKLACSPGAIAE